MKKISKLINVRTLLLAMLVPMAVNVLGMKGGGKPIGEPAGQTGAKSTSRNAARRAKNTEAKRIAEAQRAAQNGAEMGTLGENAAQTRSSNPPQLPSTPAPREFGEAPAPESLSIDLSPLTPSPAPKNAFGPTANAVKAVHTLQAATRKSQQLKLNEAPEVASEIAPEVTSEPIAEVVAPEAPAAQSAKKQSLQEKVQQTRNTSKYNITNRISNAVNNRVSYINGIFGGKGTQKTSGYDPVSGEQTVVSTNKNNKVTGVKVTARDGSVKTIKYELGKNGDPIIDLATGEPVIASRVEVSPNSTYIGMVPFEYLSVLSVPLQLGKTGRINNTQRTTTLLYKNGEISGGSVKGVNGDIGTIITLKGKGKGYEVRSTQKGKANELLETHNITETPNGTHEVVTAPAGKGSEIIQLSASFESPDGMKVFQNNRTGMTTATTRSGEPVTFLSDGSYTIQGKDSIIYVSATGKVTRTSISDWTVKRMAGQAGRIAGRAVSSAGRVAARTFSRGGFENGLIKPEVKLNSDGTIETPNGTKLSMENGDIIVELPAQKAGENPIRQVLHNKSGSISSEQIAPNGEKRVAFEDGPTWSSNGKNKSTLLNSKGTPSDLAIELSPDNILRIKKGANGENGFTEITMTDFVKELGNVTSTKASKMIDDAALKLTGNMNLSRGRTGNLFSSRPINGKSLLSNPEYQAFKKQLIEDIGQAAEMRSTAGTALDVGMRTMSFLTMYSIKGKTNTAANISKAVARRTAPKTPAAESAPALSRINSTASTASTASTTA